MKNLWYKIRKFFGFEPKYYEFGIIEIDSLYPISDIVIMNLDGDMWVETIQGIKKVKFKDEQA